MTRTSSHERRRLETLDAAALEAHQLARLNALLDAMLPSNEFYSRKFAELSRPLRSLEQLAELPFTYKAELLDSHQGDRCSILTFPPQQYVRYHQTSGTRGRPLVVLDTVEDWQWWLECWQYMLDAAHIERGDRVMMAFSFGPFVGFWSAFDAVIDRGAMAIPSGGLNTRSRLQMIQDSRATAVFCTPSYALHLAEVAAAHQIDVAALGVGKLVLSGEPGGSVHATRERIERAWNATAFDHSGASEVGPWGYSDHERRGLHVIESEFIAEFLSVETGKLAGEGELAELVLTNLGRPGMPVIRYRTGDLVRPTWPREGPSRFVLLAGGILGRNDDMLIVRGVNVFPSAVEHILRSFPEVLEYRMTAFKSGEMDQIKIEIEDRLNEPARVAEELQLRLSLKVDVTCAPLGSLPRFEGKGKRFVDLR